MFDSYKRKKLEKRRQEVLSAIRGERLAFEALIQRAQKAGETPDERFLKGVLERLGEIEQRANQESNIEELGDLIGDAEKQGQLRAYVCPRAEIADEGSLTIDVMEEWNVPRAAIAKLRASLGQKLKEADKDTEVARSALRALFEEYDSWASYTDEYEETMKGYTRWLFGSTIGLLLLAVVAFRFPLALFSLTFLGGLLCAGAAGSCVSVMSKMPLLDVSLSGELEAYGRRILSRIGVGVIASLIGCGLLGWGILPISIKDQAFSDVLNACTTSPPTSCTGVKILILLTVPMLFGFSERALTSFEQRVLGSPKGTV